MKLHIYTDGSCLKNPGKGGASAVFTDGTRHLFSRVYCEPQSTNNRMELMGLILATEIADSGVVYTDSAYCINGITQWYKKWEKNDWKTSTNKPVLNSDLWKILIENTKGAIAPDNRECGFEGSRSDPVTVVRRFEFVKVKAHSGNKFNELADSLAKHSAMKN